MLLFLKMMLISRGLFSPSTNTDPWKQISFSCLLRRLRFRIWDIYPPFPGGNGTRATQGLTFLKIQLTFSYPARRGGGIYLFNHWGMGWSQPKRFLLPQRHRRLFRRYYVGGTGPRCVVGEREKGEGEEGGKKKVDRFVRGSLARAALLLGAI